MPYNPQTWVNGAAGGTPLSAARLQNIENGIDSVDADVVAEAAARIAADATLAPLVSAMGAVVYNGLSQPVRPAGYPVVAFIGPLIDGEPPTAALPTDLHIVYVPPVTVMAGAQATATSTASAGSLVNTGIAGAQATMANTAFAGSLVAAGNIIGSQATTTNTAFAGGLHSTVIAGSQAATTNTAFAGVLSSPTVAPSLLLAENHPTDATIFTTSSSVAIPANQVSLLSIASAGGDAVAPTVTQVGVTWDLIATSGSGTASVLWLFRAGPGVAANGTITATFAVSKTYCTFQVVTCANSKPGGNGATGTGTPVSGSFLASGSQSVTLAALADARSAAVGFTVQAASNAALTEGVGYTELADFAGTSPANRSGCEWKLNTTTVDYTYSGNPNRLIGVEVKAL